ncbi:tryptophan halogenase family protein [Asticcacaulis solisilvae]|uniref:tryptophan halogenase family protein n=1 Tax=Asticcacaulis solisilvae TaxID=1217274 RepID=UPI003FD815F1
MTGTHGARSILIAGGGTAGWLTACYLARVLGGDPAASPRITLIESPEIGTIGVGEGTFPTIRITLQTLGIPEDEFLREATATFKQGNLFVDWATAPDNGRHSHYLHPFEAPFFTDGAGLPPYWLLQDKATRKPFAEAVTTQYAIALAGRAPKRRDDAPYHGLVNYAYHFNAARFAGLLRRYAVRYGVHHLQGRITGADLAEDGSIARLQTDSHGALTADLYIDCTGFRAELIGKALQSPFRPVRHQLLTDRAIACQVPYDRPDSPIPSVTASTAHAAGWTWDIGLHERRGIGYVFSSAHASDDEAMATLQAYVGPKGENYSTRVIGFDTGFRPAQWVKNCVAVGLSSGFFEPLEATNILMTEVAASMLVDFFPYSGPVDANAGAFNRLMTARNERIVDFLKLHYCLTKRTEPFWRDNTAAASLPDRLAELLAMWRHRPPSRFDISEDVDAFAPCNYQYVLYGMGFETDYEAARGSFAPRRAAADAVFDRVAQFGRRSVERLEGNRDLLDLALQVA